MPISWLKSYVDINLPVEELAERLTMAGLEVGRHRPGRRLVGSRDHRRGGVVDAAPPRRGSPGPGGRGLRRRHAGACGHRRAQPLSIREAATLPTLKVAFAMAGAVLVGAYSDQTPRPMKKLKPSKIRGVKSSGMVCSSANWG
ncbi:MAG: hypothetical protein R2838_01925 [Caldilineaceae bacterium]